MAAVAHELDAVRVVEANESAAFNALDYTCKYYLQMSAERFIELWDSGKFSQSDMEDSPGLSHAVDMLSLLRP